MSSSCIKPFKRWLFRVFRKNETAIHELNYLFWECTWRCNLSCRHCGSDCKSESCVPDMPFQDFLKAVEPQYGDRGHHWRRAFAATRFGGMR